MGKLALVSSEKGPKKTGGESCNKTKKKEFLLILIDY